MVRSWFQNQRKAMTKLVFQACIALIPTLTGWPAIARSTIDPCTMLTRNQGWASALIATDDHWKVSPGTVLAILDQESSMRGTARGQGASGAAPARNFGYAQANLQTWNWFRNATGRTDASRSDFSDSAWFVGWYFTETSKRTNLTATDVEHQYLAYKLGHGGYARSGGRVSASVSSVAKSVAQRARLWDAKLKQCLFKSEPNDDRNAEAASTTSLE